MQNFHVPLPDDLYRRLRAEADRKRRPATELARDAIGLWLAEQRKEALREAITRYAAARAGTRDDLDLALEKASLEHLADEETSR